MVIVHFTVGKSKKNPKKALGSRGSSRVVSEVVVLVLVVVVVVVVVGVVVE